MDRLELRKRDVRAPEPTAVSSHICTCTCTCSTRLVDALGPCYTYTCISRVNYTLQPSRVRRSA